MNTLYLQQLLACLLKASSIDQMHNQLQALLTPSELEEVSRRLQIFKRLHQGQTQRLIAQEMGLGIATVTRGARVYKELQNKEFLNDPTTKD